MKRSHNPRVEKLRNSYAIGCSVAEELLSTKSKEFTNGKGARDIMSLLSAYFPLLVSLFKLTALVVRANACSDHAARLSGEEMISQVLYVNFTECFTLGPNDECFPKIEVWYSQDMTQRAVRWSGQLWSSHGILKFKLNCAARSDRRRAKFTNAVILNSLRSTLRLCPISRLS